ncbi:MAG: hypothetical protein A4E57_04568 [Syntrophorhabdaceae bacterium PtaU1.Bin034]|jgi:hypothetical protein|nr:MAG: hypothetical protein A4E57_04568 [Syntrophorhabdaceae bacterium PtaU1.Bin034]
MLGVRPLRIAIDVDNTITANPQFFRLFIENQLRAGNEVHVLTGRKSSGEEGNQESPGERVEQLRKIGITNYTRLIQITRRTQHPDIGIGKGEYCRDNLIDMVLEDDILYIQEISRISPTTQAFLIA